MNNIDEQIKFKLAEEVMIRTIWSSVDKDAAKDLANQISKLICESTCTAEVAIAAIVILHHAHVLKAGEIMFEQSNEIPPWVQ